jgi:hypothetical protein
MDVQGALLPDSEPGAPQVEQSHHTKQISGFIGTMHHFYARRLSDRHCPWSSRPLEAQICCRTSTCQVIPRQILRNLIPSSGSSMQVSLLNLLVICLSYSNARPIQPAMRKRISRDQKFPKTHGHCALPNEHVPDMAFRKGSRPCAVNLLVVLMDSSVIFVPMTWSLNFDGALRG